MTKPDASLGMSCQSKAGVLSGRLAFVRLALEEASLPCALAPTGIVQDSIDGGVGHRLDPAGNIALSLDGVSGI